MDRIEVEKTIDFIKEYFKLASFAKGAVVGMSGGKDSLVVAKLCTEALGKESVFGVIMPNGEMLDKHDAQKSCELLGIKYQIVNISKAYKEVLDGTTQCLKPYNLEISNVTKVNTAPRIRMTLLYAIAGSMNYLVANTSNLSETMTGYTTKWGDNVGDFAPIANFTKTEVCEMGELLGLPKDLVYKNPSDGLSGKSDEENMEITYQNLDSLIRNGNKNSDYEQIIKLNKLSEHKRVGVAKFENSRPNYLKDINNR